MKKRKEQKNWNWTNEEWTVPQLAAFLGVSSTFIRNKINERIIKPVKGGRLVDGDYPDEREYYKTSRDEVKRIISELPLPPTGETFEQRIKRGNKRLYSEIGIPIDIEQLCQLENIGRLYAWREQCLKITRRKPRKKR